MCKPHYDARPKTGRNNLTEPELDISYALPPGGLPAQSERLADRAVFTTAYAFIPKQ
jgi:hypothetical protein